MENKIIGDTTKSDTNLGTTSEIEKFNRSLVIGRDLVNKV